MSASLNNTTLFSPQGELDIYTAAEQKAQLLQALAAATALQIDLSGVTLLDSAGLQLLVLARQEAQRRNLPLSFTGHSAAVTAVLDLCNLAGFFADQVFIPSGTRKAGEQP